MFLIFPCTSFTFISFYKDFEGIDVLTHCSNIIPNFSIVITETIYLYLLLKIVVFYKYICSPPNYGSSPSLTLRQEPQRELRFIMLKGVTRFLLEEQSLQNLLEKCINQSWQNQSTSWGKNSIQGNLGNIMEDG